MVVGAGGGERGKEDRAGGLHARASKCASKEVHSAPRLHAHPVTHAHVGVASLTPPPHLQRQHIVQVPVSHVLVVRANEHQAGSGPRGLQPIASKQVTKVGP